MRSHHNRLGGCETYPRVEISEIQFGQDSYL